MTGAAVVHLVHCIDAEGPLDESLEATFERLSAIYGIDLPPSRETLDKIQRRALDLGGIEEDVARTFAPDLLRYNRSWDQIDAMLDEMMAPPFRTEVPDSFGGGWIYNWHCLDHVGFLTNPRRRDMGYHNVFDYYRAKVRATASVADGLHFHHHPVPISRSAIQPASAWFAHTPEIFQILARRIIDRTWFPCVHRPGFHTTRPDGHWFLEQYIPFDYANQASCDDPTHQRDQGDGRFGDWRRAPRTWTPYHPSHDDYQVPGGCRRWIARCLNVGTRLRLVRQVDVDQAFAEAAAGQPVVLAVTCHDFRDMRPAVKEVQAMLLAAAARYPQVRFRYCEAREAMRSALGLAAGSALSLTLDLGGNRLTVEATHPIFGPQPFLAMKTRCGHYHSDNLDVQEPSRRYSYIFDEQTLPLDGLAHVGVGACDAAGNVAVSVLDVRTGRSVSVCH